MHFTLSKKVKWNPGTKNWLLMHPCSSSYKLLAGSLTAVSVQDVLPLELQFCQLCVPLTLASSHALQSHVKTALSLSPSLWVSSFYMSLSQSSFRMNQVLLYRPVLLLKKWFSQGKVFEYLSTNINPLFSRRFICGILYTPSRNFPLTHYGIVLFHNEILKSYISMIFYFVPSAFFH